MLVGYFQQHLLNTLESMHDFIMTFSEEPREKKDFQATETYRIKFTNIKMRIRSLG